RDPRRPEDGSVLAKPVALETDDDRLVLTPLAGGVERLDIDRQVRLEVVVERDRAIADPWGQRGAGPGLSADDDRWWRIRDGEGDGVIKGVERRGPRHGAAGPQRPYDRHCLLDALDPLGRRGEVDAVGSVLTRRAPDADPEDQPATGCDVKRRGHAAHDRRMAGHHVHPERPARPSLRLRRRHAQDRPVLDHRHGPVRALPDEVVPRPDTGKTRIIEPPRALQPPVGRRADRPQTDADRQSPAVASRHRYNPVSNSRMSSGEMAWPSPRVGPSASRAPSASRSAGKRPTRSRTTFWIRSAFCEKTSSTL